MCEVIGNPPEWEDNWQSNTCKDIRKIIKLYFDYGQPWTFALESHLICKLVGFVSQQQERKLGYGSIYTV